MSRRGIAVLAGAAILIAAPAVVRSQTSATVQVDSLLAAPKVQDSAGHQRDSFIGLDKPKHFLISAFVESVAFNSLKLSGVGRKPSFALASVVTGVVGVAREMHDRKTKGLFSLGDLLWDAIGAGASGVMLHHTYR